MKYYNIKYSVKLLNITFKNMILITQDILILIMNVNDIDI